MIYSNCSLKTLQCSLLLLKKKFLGLVDLFAEIKPNYTKSLAAGAENYVFSLIIA